MACKTVVLSGFACNGKSTLTEDFSKTKDDILPFQEPVYHIVNYLDKSLIENKKQFQTLIVASSLYQLQEILFLKKLQKKLFVLCDRCILDVFAYCLLYEVYSEKDIKQIFQNLRNHLVDYPQPIFDTIYFIESCKETQFIIENCLNDTRKKFFPTIEDFINFSEKFKEKYFKVIELMLDSKIKLYGNLILTNNTFPKYHQFLDFVKKSVEEEYLLWKQQNFKN